MYLLSLYFDNQTELALSGLMDRVAEKSGNFYMQENCIPPHLTIAALKEMEEERIVSALDTGMRGWRPGSLDFAAIGCFRPHVLFLYPVLNEYLNGLSLSAHGILTQCGGVKEDSKYKPLNWLPHVTVARQLSEEQMQAAFRVLQANFTPFSGTVTRVALSRSGPCRDVREWALG